MYETLTQYIKDFAGDEFGTWIIDRKNNGTPDHPFQMPFVNYSKVVDRFIRDFYSFVDAHKEIGLNDYSGILNANGIEWGKESMENAILDNLDAKCVLALILGAIRAERFCSGALLGFFESGAMIKWLIKLKELDI